MYKAKAKEIVSKLTLEEKASLCSGHGFWHTKSVDRVGIPSVLLSDGPHGLRKQAGEADHLGINESVPATCFPTAATTASSFDRSLLKKIGEALGEESLQEDVAVLLGPGANIKRSPLCGRNFEYFSEDPYVSGEMATAIIEGIQSKDVSTSLKHFAANNQEKRRLISNSVVDERALREIYLSGFEKAVRTAKPHTVMCSYNLVNGEYASENKTLLTDILRDEWGFDGLLMTDWGACNDRVAGLVAGQDLEMPFSGGYNDKAILSAVNEGSLSIDLLDRAVERLLVLVLQYMAGRKDGYKYDVDAHHTLARHAAAASAVLLKNEDAILPLAQDASVAVIGALARTPRYQGAGSSKINPIRLDNVWDELAKTGLILDYAQGYTLGNGKEPDEVLMTEAVKLAASMDVVVVVAGLPDEYESEGYDRGSLHMPASHNLLIEAVSAVNPNIVVVLQSGAPITMPWIDKVKGVLLAYLGGQAGGGAIADLLTGKINPSGKLAESFPLCIEDTPCYNYFDSDALTEEYRESIFVGYRYYDTAQKSVLFPFGYGLSYATFAYSDIVVSGIPDTNGAFALSSVGFGDVREADRTIEISLTVKNTSEICGAEIVQLYVAASKSDRVFRPNKELKGFEKILLEPGASGKVTFSLDRRSFAYYNTAISDWAVEGGEYSILIGASSKDVRLETKVSIVGDGKEALLAGTASTSPIYFNLPSDTLDVPDNQFESLYGRPLPPRLRSHGDPYTVNSTLADIKHLWIGKLFLKIIKKYVMDMVDSDMDDPDVAAMAESMLFEMPLRNLSGMSEGALPRARLDGIIALANKKIGKGLKGLLLNR